MLNQIQSVAPHNLFLGDYKPHPRESSWLTSAMSRAGKSTVERYIQSIFPHRCFVIDSLAEYNQKALSDLDSLKLFAKKNKSSNFGRMVWRWKQGTTERERLNTINYICMYMMSMGDLHFCIEEAHKYCSPHSIPTALSQIWTEARHYGLTKSASTQRLAKVHPDFGQAERKIFGQQDYNADVDRAADMLRVDRDTVLEIKRFEFLHKLQTDVVKFNTKDMLERVNKFR